MRKLSQIERNPAAGAAKLAVGDAPALQLVCAALILGIVAIALRIAMVW